MNHQAMQDAFDELKKKIDVLLEERDFLRHRVETLERTESLARSASRKGRDSRKMLKAKRI